MRTALPALARLAAIALLGALAACSKQDAPACFVDAHPPARETFVTTVRAVDEAGRPVAGAVVDPGDGSKTTGATGDAALGLGGPALLVVSAPGYLSEPVTVGWEDAGQIVEVRLLREQGRIAVHTAGDVMFGRRYEAPAPGATPLVPQADAANGARSVVENARRLFLAADIRTLNFETVVSDQPDTDAYPGKKYILRSRPGSVAGLNALEPTVVGHANNHTRDFGDPGIAATLAALDGAKIPHIGSSPRAGAEAPGARFDVRGTRVGVLAWTNLDGSFINDAYALDGAPAPPAPDAKTAFQYEPRSWGFAAPTFAVPTATRRAGSAWLAFRDAEQATDPSTDVAAWQSLSRVYPEIQDWIVRRGHGGALGWDATASAKAIADLKAQSDVVIVNLHGGLQFIDAAPLNMKQAARAAIDAGADMVVAHHPHVLQGFEFYKGKLIAYSLGNFVFDQDFFSTFASMLLRTVWEGSRMIEARIVPMEIDRYRPAALAGDAARRRALDLWQRSVVGAASNRDAAGHVRDFVDVAPAGAVPATLVFERSTARIVAEPPAPVRVAIHAAAGAITPIAFSGLVDARLGLADTAPDAIYVGRDLFQWGRFEDTSADGAARGDMHWDVTAGDCDQDVTVASDAFEGRGYLRLVRHRSNTGAVLVRPIARIPLPHHRLYDDTVNQRPLDPEPTYSVRFAARRNGPGAPSLRIETFLFDDTALTEDPTSTALANVDLPIPVPPDGAWHVIDVPIPRGVLGAPGGTANMAFFHMRLEPSADATTTFDVDDVQFVEWRRAAGMPDRYGFFELVRNDGAAAMDLSASGWAL